MTDEEIVALLGSGFSFSQREDYDLALEIARRVAVEMSRRLETANEQLKLAKESDLRTSMVNLSLAEKNEALRAEIERLTKNDYTGKTCAFCLGGIRERESRCEEGGVWSHPLCKVSKERDVLNLQIERWRPVVEAAVAWHQADADTIEAKWHALNEALDVLGKSERPHGDRPRCPKCYRPSLFQMGSDGLCVHCDSTHKDAEKREGEPRCGRPRLESIFKCWRSKGHDGPHENLTSTWND